MTHAGHQLSLFSQPQTKPAARREILARAVAVDSPNLSEAAAVIQDLWRADVDSRDMSPQTFDRYCPLVDRYVRFSERHGHLTLDDALGTYDVWLNAQGRDRSGRPAPPSLSTRHLRSCAVGALYRSARSLGWTSAHPPYVTREANETTRQGRPLVEPEFDTIRAIASAMKHSRHAAAIAIALSGGGTADIANMTTAHVDLRDGTLTLPGSRLISARKVRIPGQWEYDILAERLSDLRQLGHEINPGIVVRRQGGDASRQSGAAIAITQVLTVGQLKADPAMKPASLCRWAALEAFETSGDISTAATLLGTRSLDTAAFAIAWDWSAQGMIVVREPRPDYRPGVVT